MATFGDRRSVPRFDIIGTLWGQLELAEPVRLLNVNLLGALLESPVPAALDSLRPVHLMIDSRRFVVDTRVRHLRQVPSEGPKPRYLVGIEFVAPPEPLLESIRGMADRSRPADS